MAIFQDISLERLTTIKNSKKSKKNQFTLKTGFSFKDLTQSSKSSLIQMVTLNDLVDRLDLFTKRSIN